MMQFVVVAQPPSFMACLFSGAKQMASTWPASAASMQASSARSTDARRRPAGLG